MSIIDYFQNNKILNFKYYELSNSHTRKLASTIINNADSIYDYFSNSIQLNGFSQIADYVWIRNILKIEKSFDVFEESTRLELKKILVFINNYKFDKITILDYIKMNYKKILEKKSIPYTSFQTEIIIFVLKQIYSKNDYFGEEVISYIEKEKPELIISNINKLDRYYQNDYNRFCLLMDSKQFDIYFNLENYNDTFRMLDKSRTKIIQKFLEIETEKTLDKIILLINHLTVDNYQNSVVIINDFQQILNEKNYRYLNMTQLDDLQPFLYSLNNEYLKRFGKLNSFYSFDNEYEIKMQKEGLTSDKSSYYYLAFTHIKNRNENKFQSYYVDIFNREDSYTDILIKPENTDDYFQHLKLTEAFFRGELLKISLKKLIISTETKDIMFSEMEKYLAIIDEIDGMNKTEFKDSYHGMFNSLVELIKTSEKNIIDSNFNFKSKSLAMYLIGYIEKLLRTIYINRVKDREYIKENDLNLGAILRTKNKDGSDHKNILVDVFDLDLIRYLEYRLVKTYDTEIGNNLRNDIMHDRFIKMKNFTSEIVMDLYILFMNVVNGLISNYINSGLLVIITEGGKSILKKNNK